MIARGTSRERRVIALASRRCQAKLRRGGGPYRTQAPAGKPRLGWNRSDHRTQIRPDGWPRQITEPVRFACQEQRRWQIVVGIVRVPNRSLRKIVPVAVKIDRGLNSWIITTIV